MADNISLNKSSIDLTNNKQESVTVENTGATTANVTLINSVSGVEWSDDAGQNWNTGGDSFNLTSGNKGYQIGGAGNENYNCVEISGEYIYASFTTTSNPFDGETTGSNTCAGITKRNKGDFSKVWTVIFSDATYNVDEVVFKRNPADGKLFALYHADNGYHKLVRYDVDGNEEASLDLSETLGSFSHVYDLCFDGTTSVFCVGRSVFTATDLGYVKKVNYALTTINWTFRALSYVRCCSFNSANDKVYFITNGTGNNFDIKSLNQSGVEVDTKQYATSYYTTFSNMYVDDSENIYSVHYDYVADNVYFRKDTFSANQWERSASESISYGGYIDVTNENMYSVGQDNIISVGFDNTLNWSVADQTELVYKLLVMRAYVDNGLLYIGSATDTDFGATNQGGEDAVIYTLSTADGTLNYTEGEAKDYIFRYLPTATTLSIPSEVSFSSTNTETVYCDVKPINDFGNVTKGDTSSLFTLRIENIDTITRAVSSIVAPTGFQVKKSSDSTWGSSIQSFDITSSSYEDIDFRSNTSQIGDISESATLSYNPTISIGLSLSSLPSDFKVEYIDSHVDNAKGRLIRQYRQGSNVEDICGALVGPLQTSEDDLFGLYSMLDIDTMTGVNLDRIGAIIGQERGGYNDENYRTFLKARVKINNSTGTIDEIVELWNLFNPGETIEVREQFPAQIELLTTAERPSTDIENAIYNLMYESKQAGVRLVWIIPYTVEGDGIFKFDSTNSADQFDSGVFNRILHD